MRAIVLWALLTLGCAHSRQENTTPSCRSPERAGLPPIPGPVSQPGKLAVEKTDAGVIVSADGVSLAAVAVRLAAVLQRDLTVSAEIAEVPVTVRVVGASDEQAIGALSSRFVEAITFRETEPKHTSFVRRDPSRWRTSRELNTRLLVVRPELAASLAQATCAVASPGAYRASALEEQLMIDALPEEHDALNKLVHFVDEHAGDATAEFDCQSPRLSPESLPTTTSQGALAVLKTTEGVTVRAERVPLHRLVMETASALNVRVRVDPRVADASITLALEHATRDTIAEALVRLGLKVDHADDLVVGPAERRIGAEDRLVGAVVMESSAMARAQAKSMCLPEGGMDAAAAVGNVLLFRGRRWVVSRGFGARPVLITEER